MPAAADGDAQAGAVPEPHGGDDVGHACAPGDDRRVAVDRPVPHVPVLLIGRVRGPDDLPPEARRQLVDRRLVDLDTVHRARHGSSPQNVPRQAWHLRRRSAGGMIAR